MSRLLPIALLAALSLPACLVLRSGARQGPAGADGDGDADGDADGVADGDRLPPECSDRALNGDETDVDCGGRDCAPCRDDQRCRAAEDCRSGVCVGGTCQPSSCDDAVQNGDESDVDCGGDCLPCPHGRPCDPGGQQCAPLGLCVAGVCDVVGDGRDGRLTVADGERVANPVAGPASASAESVVVTLLGGVAGFEAGQRVLLHQSRGSGAGRYEVARVAEVDPAGELVLDGPLAHDYVTADGDRAQVIVVPEHSEVVISAAGRLSARPWDGSTGGIVALVAQGEVSVGSGGSIDASGVGFRGPPRPAGSFTSGEQGEGHLGDGATSWRCNGSGGGGGGRVESCGSGVAGSGGGGGHAGLGVPGRVAEGCHPGGAPGRAVGGDTKTLVFGGAGGAGGADEDGLGAAGGSGGGVLVMTARSLSVAGTVTVDGEPGGREEHAAGCGSGGGGGGAGGAAALWVSSADIGSSILTARGGAGGDDPALCGDPGGSGADGRVYLVADSVRGESSPHWVSSGSCGDPGSCPAAVAGSCADLTFVLPSPEDGTYWIDPDGQGALQARCDMTSDGGGGYTMLRIDDPVLGGHQYTYALLCSQYGMQVIVPRTAEHAFAVQGWNDGVIPNLANVFPAYDGAEGLGEWRGFCGDASCTFWLSPTNNASCSGGTEPNGNNTVAYRLFRVGDACVEGHDYGSWDDNHSNVHIQGWVICSPNDR